jgi:hypothetical protein
MLPYTRSVLTSLGALASVTFVIAACGSDGGSAFGDPDAAGNALESGTFNPADKPDGGDPFANDPPPKFCVLDGGPAAPTVGGTAECPDDKNKPGCGCKTAGETAACWTGLRINRHNGVCKDGMTTCMQVNETALQWGPCNGEVLPASGATKGKDACKCFSLGSWKLANLSPCFFTYAGDTAHPYPVSTVTDGTGSSCDPPTNMCRPVGQADCPKLPAGSMAPPSKPGTDWTTDTLTVDCAGHFKVCYQLKAGDIKNPLPTDCAIMDKICVEADYIKENVEQTFPPLPGWTSTAANTDCALKWRTTGGYGEMTVQGESVLCDKVDDGSGGSVVFNRVQYCPSKCEDAANAMDPECVNCKQDGSGVFK